MVKLLRQFELAPLNLLESAVVALDLDLAADGGVERTARGLAASSRFPDTSVHRLGDDVPAVHRTLTTLQDKGGSLEEALCLGVLGATFARVAFGGLDRSPLAVLADFFAVVAALAVPLVLGVLVCFFMMLSFLLGPDGPVIYNPSSSMSRFISVLPSILSIILISHQTS